LLYLSGSVRGGYVGPVMRTPNGGTDCPGQPWAADTGCWSQPAKYDDDRYLAWLDKQDRSSCLFATAPDVVGDAEATLDRALPVLPRIRALGYRAALVAQPTMTTAMVPWDELDALFVGGPDWWHVSEGARDLLAEAKRRGKWVHEGRVNSWKRYDRARAMGYDSADGTVLRFDPQRDVAAWMERAQLEPHIWDLANLLKEDA
jgi:hypothetical protein